MSERIRGRYNDALYKSTYRTLLYFMLTEFWRQSEKIRITLLTFCALAFHNGEWIVTWMLALASSMIPLSLLKIL